MNTTVISVFKEEESARKGVEGFSFRTPISHSSAEQQKMTTPKSEASQTFPNFCNGAFHNFWKTRNHRREIPENMMWLASLPAAKGPSGKNVVQVVFSSFGYIKAALGTYDKWLRCMSAVLPVERSVLHSLCLTGVVCTESHHYASDTWGSQNVAFLWASQRHSHKTHFALFWCFEEATKGSIPPASLQWSGVLYV